MANGSRQDEHIFNALGDLANELAEELTRELSTRSRVDTAKRVVAAETIKQLRGAAANLIRERNNADGTATPES